MPSENRVADLYVDTATVVQVNGGIVRVLLVGQDARALARVADPPSGETPAPPSQATEPKTCLVMPLPGFLYLATLIKSALAEPRMKQQIERMRSAGLLPPEEEVDPVPPIPQAGGRSTLPS